MNKLSTLPRLTKEQEIVLAKRWQQHGDTRARNALIESNMRLVISLACQLSHHGRSRDDLVQEGILGMMRACDKFDPELGIPFGSYAWHWVRSRMTSSVMHDWTMVSGGSGCLRTNRFFTLLSKRRRVLAETGSEQRAVEVVAKEMHQSEGQIRAWFERIDHRDSSFDSPMLRDLTSDDRSPEDLVAGAEHLNIFVRELQRAIDSLTPRQQQVVWAIMDSDENDPCLQTIGTKIGVSRERVRQLRNKAFDAIREHMMKAA